MMSEHKHAIKIAEPAEGLMDSPVEHFFLKISMKNLAITRDSGEPMTTTSI
jgi:hypothetical protein